MNGKTLAIGRFVIQLSWWKRPSPGMPASADSDSIFVNGEEFLPPTKEEQATLEETR